MLSARPYLQPKKEKKLKFPKCTFWEKFSKNNEKLEKENKTEYKNLYK